MEEWRFSAFYAIRKGDSPMSLREWLCMSSKRIYEKKKAQTDQSVKKTTDPVLFALMPYLRDPHYRDSRAITNQIFADIMKRDLFVKYRNDGPLYKDRSYDLREKGENKTLLQLAVEFVAPAATPESNKQRPGTPRKKSSSGNTKVVASDTQEKLVEAIIVVDKPIIVAKASTISKHNAQDASFAGMSVYQLRLYQFAREEDTKNDRVLRYLKDVILHRSVREGIYTL